MKDGSPGSMPSGSRFRLAVIGAGRMGRTHIAAIIGSTQVEITGVVEPDPATHSATFRASGGGILADLGVHEFDQVRWLTGQEFTTARTARTAQGTAEDDPDCAQIACELDGGSTAVISLGRWHPAGDSCKVEVYGTKGTSDSWFLPPAGGEAVFRQALRLQAEDFARLVTTGAGTGARAADAIAALKAAELAARRLKP